MDRKDFVLLWNHKDILYCSACRYRSFIEIEGRCRSFVCAYSQSRHRYSHIYNNTTDNLIATIKECRGQCRPCYDDCVIKQIIKYFNSNSMISSI